MPLIGEPQPERIVDHGRYYAGESLMMAQKIGNYLGVPSPPTKEGGDAPAPQTLSERAVDLTSAVQSLHDKLVQVHDHLMKI